MSHSVRQPYASWCGHNHSAAKDKHMAGRAVRRKQNAAIRQAWVEDAFENFLLPDRYECGHNEVWTWVRDGTNRLQRPESRRYRHELGIALQLERDDLLDEAWRDALDLYRWWLDLHRK